MYKHVHNLRCKGLFDKPGNIIEAYLAAAKCFKVKVMVPHLAQYLDTEAKELDCSLAWGQRILLPAE